MRGAIRLLVVVANLTVPLSWSAAATAAEGTQFELKIESQDLDAALQEFSRQSGIQVIFFSRVTRGLVAPSLKGSFTLDTAMTRLLGDSRLTFRSIDLQTIEIQRSDSAQDDRKAAGPANPEVESAKPEQLDEVIVVGTAEQLVATRIATPLREIPQTISVVTSEQIRLLSDATWQTCWITHPDSRLVAAVPWMSTSTPALTSSRHSMSTAVQLSTPE